MPRLIIPLVVVLGCPLGGRAEFDKKAREIERLVKQLGDDSFKVREEAGRKLVREYGESALEALDQAARSDDAEVARRAGELIRAIEKSLAAEVRQLRGHTDQVLAVAFDKDGGRCATG